MAKNTKPQNAKMNSYIFAFFAFLIVIFIAFMLTRYQTNAYETGETKAGETHQHAEGEEVVVTKFADISPEKAKLLKDVSGDYYLGKQYAPVLIVEYASLSCPHCAHFHAEVLEKLIPTYIETGKVKYVFRDFPLNRQALDAAKLTHCVPGDKYFGFVKALFKAQENWAFTPKYEEVLKSIGKLGGVDEAKYNSCMADKAIEEKILKGQKDAVEILEVSSTPTIFINGHHYNRGNDYNKVAQFIDELLKGE